MDTFANARREYEKLKARFDAGQIDKQSFQKAVEDLTITDSRGDVWQIGAASGDWYRLEGGQWVKDFPPPATSQSPSSPPVSSTSSPPPPPVSSSAPPPPLPSDPQTLPDYGETEVTKPKKKRRGCLIAMIVIVAILVCVGTIFVGSQLLSDGEFSREFNFSTGNQDTFIDVENQAGFPICAVYISPSDSDDWGPNLLDSGETIASGSFVSYPATVGETIDIYAEDCQGNEVDTLYDIYVPQEGITVTYSPNP